MEIETFERPSGRCKSWQSERGPSIASIKRLFARMRIVGNDRPDAGCCRWRDRFGPRL